MTTFPYRKQTILAAVLVTVSVTGGWAYTSYVPRAEALELKKLQIRGEETALRQTRAAVLRLGAGGMEAEIARLRAEVERREALVPATSPETAEQAALRIREQIGRLAQSYGVQVYVNPIPTAEENGFRVDGYRVEATGDYHRVGAWTADVLSLDRLTGISEAHLQVEPDSLLKPLMEKRGEVGAAPAIAVPGAGALTADPLDAVVRFTYRWYSLASPARAAAAPVVDTLQTVTP